MVVEQWGSCGSRVLADINRHERELDGLCNEFRESNRQIIKALGEMREDLNRRIDQQNQAIVDRDRDVERRNAERFEQTSIELAALRHTATWRASLLGLAAGAVPVLAGLVYLMIRLAN